MDRINTTFVCYNSIMGHVACKVTCKGALSFKTWFALKKFPCLNEVVKEKLQSLFHWKTQTDFNSVVNYIAP